MSRIFLASVLCIILIGISCVSEYEDPYDDYVEPQFNWPTLDPNRYHWDGFANPFYETWSYKVTDSKTGRSFYFIYGVQNPGAEIDEYSGGFLYVRADDGDFLFAPVPLSQFDASIARCDVTIAGARATENKFSGTILHEQGNISWNVSLDILSKWPRTMGLLTNIPALSSNWFVNALNARATGVINWRGEKYIFEDAPAYNDHSWGWVFPKAWIYIQSNGFFNPNEAVAVAGGPVDLGLLEPSAHMLVYKTDERLYEFRTQDLNTKFITNINLETARVVITAIRGFEKVVVTVDASPQDLLSVLVPRYEGMIPGSKQTMRGAFIVELYLKNEETMLWELANRSTSNVGTLGLGGQYGGYDFQ